MMPLTRAIKRTLRFTGHYTRRLQGDSFPGVAVLCYHGLRDDRWPDGTMPLEGLHVRAREFEAHCAVISSTCHPITLAQWAEAAAGGQPLPPRPVLITFDDGYRTVLTIARPILERFRVPAAVFVCTEPVEERTAFWFDAVARARGEAAVATLKTVPYRCWRDASRADRTPVCDDEPHAPLTKEDIRDLANAGFEIGGHTASHPILARASAEEQRIEIAENRARLEAWTGRPVTAFAYPNGEPGDYTVDTRSILRQEGFDFAFTTTPGFAGFRAGFDAPRFLMLSGIDGAEFGQRLAYSWRAY